MIVKNKYDGKIDLLKLMFRFHLPETIYRFAMGSPLGPVLAGIFMVNLERSLVPLLKDQLSFWKRYVDDTITFIKTGSAEYVLLILNSFHPNIECTYKTEVNSKLAFLDVLLLREGQNIKTAGIFMVNLERSLVPLLKDQLSFWKRYVDDTITFIKTGSGVRTIDFK